MVFNPEGCVPPEVRRDITIEHNLDLMNTEMASLLVNESMGGNAGGVEVNGREYPASGANGYFDSRSGEIIRFGNIQSIPEPIRKKFDKIQFHVARVFEPGINIQRPPIVDTIYRTKEPSDEAQRVMKESVDRYNMGCAGDFEGLNFMLEMMGGLTGSGGEQYDVESLKKLAEQVRRDEISNKSLTRTAGFREKVIELVTKEYESGQR